MRTTLDLDGPVLREAKALAKREGKSLGQLVSELLAVALRQRAGENSREAAPASWIAKPMGALADLSDREALYGAMERPDPVQRVAEEP
jgi:hypothetical protein